MAMNIMTTSRAPIMQYALPEGLPVLRARVTMRLLAETQLPKFKGALLRGGFGHAFQRASCPRICWKRSHECTISAMCPYRWVFETPHPPDVAHLHDLRDVPRPFVIEPPIDGRTAYAAGDTLEFGLVLIGRGNDFLPFFLFAFEQLGHMGIGKQSTPARLERVEALHAWRPTGQVVYQDGQVLSDADGVSFLDGFVVAERAKTLSEDVYVSMVTPLRIKSKGDWMRTLDPVALIRTICWRINALSIFHGAGPWDVDYRPLVEQAQAIAVEQEQVHWVDWGRTSGRVRQGAKHHMVLGGIVGGAVLRGVSPELRMLLLAASLVHVGKATVFGHGAVRVERATIGRTSLNEKMSK